jgi:hypothetical protein
MIWALESRPKLGLRLSDVAKDTRILKSWWDIKRHRDLQSKTIKSTTRDVQHAHVTRRLNDYVDGEE